MDARFCARCGQQIREEQIQEELIRKEQIQREQIQAQQTHDASSASNNQAPDDLVSELSLETKDTPGAKLISGKVQTSPFPPLPETGAALILPELKLNGSAVHALLAQANLYRMRRDWSVAIDCCVSVLRSQPANQTAHVLLGDIYRDQRRFDDAVQWYGMAVELRPNPTDQAKLEFAMQERERLLRQAAQKARQGYGNSASAPIDRGTDLNTGTTNLMGVSPRRWLRGITVTSLAFVVLVLLGLVWTSVKNPRLNSASAGNNPTAGYSGSNSNSGLPPHRLDRTVPSYLAAQAANKNNTVVVGGGGLSADHNMHTTTITPDSNAAPIGGRVTDPSQASGRQGASALNPNSGIGGATLPSAPVVNVRPLPGFPSSSASSTGSSNPQSASSIASTSQPSNRLTDGVSLTQNVSDGSIGAMLMLTAAPSLVLEGGPRGQDSVLRNIYRAARTAFTGSNILVRVKVMVETQVQGTGLAVVLEAELDRGTAMKANTDTDSTAQLQSHLLSYRFSGASQDTNPTASPSSNPAGSESPSQ